MLRYGDGERAGMRMGRRRKILHVVDARPNFMKIAPVMRAVGASERIAEVLAGWSFVSP